VPPARSIHGHRNLAQENARQPEKRHKINDHDGRRRIDAARKLTVDQMQAEYLRLASGSRTIGPKPPTNSTSMFSGVLIGRSPLSSILENALLIDFVLKHL